MLDRRPISLNVGTTHLNYGILRLSEQTMSISLTPHCTTARQPRNVFELVQPLLNFTLHLCPAQFKMLICTHYVIVALTFFQVVGIKNKHQILWGTRYSLPCILTLSRIFPIELFYNLGFSFGAKRTVFVELPLIDLNSNPTLS